MKIIVGLGNPEEKYLRTRHNLGFMVVDHLAPQLEMECNQKKFQSLFCKKAIKEDKEIRLLKQLLPYLSRRPAVVREKEEEIILLKPQTFMNLSGVAVKEVVDMYKCVLQDIMVVCDDLDLPLGKMRIRRNGGCGGHRGLESITACLGTTEFSRLRIGIERPTVGDASDYVLSVFPEKDEAVVMKALEDASQALKIWVFEGIEACMNAFN